MEYDITTAPEHIDFAPASKLLEIFQNVRMILTTTKYSVPLDRLFGLDPSIVDMPMPAAQAKLTAEIVRAIHKYEPRCRVVRVWYDGNMDGRLIPTVRIRILDEDG